MATFDECKTGLDSVSERIGQNRKRLAQAEAMIAQSEADLAAIPSGYADVIASIDAAVVADPEDTAWVNAKAAKDKLVAAFLTVKDTATAMKDALAAL